MSTFLLLLHDLPDNPFLKMSPEEMQREVARYGEWAGQMAAQGRLKGGEKLEDLTARHLTGNGSKMTITDGPFPETKEVIGGYFLLHADSYDEAVELAATCPHLDHGRIEVRRIEPMS